MQTFLTKDLPSSPEIGKVQKQESSPCAQSCSKTVIYPQISQKARGIDKTMHFRLTVFFLDGIFPHVTQCLHWVKVRENPPQITRYPTPLSSKPSVKELSIRQW